MKIKITIVLTLCAASEASAQWVVTDQLMLEQKIIEMTRLGDPAAFRNLEGFGQLSKSLIAPGTALSLHALQEVASGVNAFIYTGNGLYQPVLDHVVTAAGVLIPRAEAEYKKFDAIAQTTTNFKEVQKEIQEKVTQLRQGISDTVSRVLSATTEAEVQKLHTLLTSQNTQLASLERERDAALARVLVQDVENRNDAQRQIQARVEEGVAAFQNAQEKMGQFLVPSSSPVTLPAPGGALP